MVEAYQPPCLGSDFVHAYVHNEGPSPGLIGSADEDISIRLDFRPRPPGICGMAFLVSLLSVLLAVLFWRVDLFHTPSPPSTAPGNGDLLAIPTGLVFQIPLGLSSWLLAQTFSKYRASMSPTLVFEVFSVFGGSLMLGLAWLFSLLGVTWGWGLPFDVLGIEFSTNDIMRYIRVAAIVLIFASSIGIAIDLFAVRFRRYREAMRGNNKLAEGVD
jgi:hypothetical protein